jgi:hypothetical protein
MKSLKLFILLSIITVSITTCKKYPEGGWSNMAKRHLFGGTKAGSSKTWHLSKYEVNGIDSTMYITPGNGYTSFENDEYTFFIDKVLENYMGARSKVYRYSVNWGGRKTVFETAKKNIEIGVSGTGTSSLTTSQCGLAGCERKIFNPNFKNALRIWSIKKLTSTSLVLVTEDSGSLYKIILKH